MLNIIIINALKVAPIKITVEDGISAIMLKPHPINVFDNSTFPKIDKPVSASGAINAGVPAVPDKNASIPWNS